MRFWMGALVLLTAIGVAQAAESVPDPLGIQLGRPLPGDCAKTEIQYVFRCRAPKPNPKLSPTATVIVAPDRRVVRIVGDAVIQDMSGQGNEIRQKTEEMRLSLERRYGAPTGGGDVLQEGSVWDKPENYMMALSVGERIVAWYWDNPLPKLGNVFMEVTSKRYGVAVLRVYWNTADADKVVREWKQKADDESL